MSIDAIEPRVWNLVVGLGLASCNVGPGTNAEDESTSTSGTESTSTTDTESESTGDGDGDGDNDCSDPGGECPMYYECIDGECVPFECLDHYNCGPFEECIDWHCTTVGAPPPGCQFDLLDIPTELQIDDSALALSFVDLDDDGRDHLVVATEAELRIYEFGVDAPTIVPRDPSSPAIRSMAAGQFDDQPGEDLMLIVDSEIHRYFSDGTATFLNPSVEPSPSPSTSDVIAGDFDGQPPTDFLTWGWDDTDAMLHVGGMAVPLVSDDSTGGAAFFPFGSSNPGLLLETDGVKVFDLMGNVVASQMWLHIEGSPVAIETPDAAVYVGSSPTHSLSTWSRLKRMDPTSGADFGWPPIFIDDDPMLAAADLGGDLYPEIVAGGRSTTIIFDPLGDPCFVHIDLGVDTYFVDELDVGDHDGDADEEVAIRLSSNGVPWGVLIIDGEL